MKIQVEPYFAFIFFKLVKAKWQAFTFTSVFNLLDENTKEIGDVKEYIAYLFMYHYQGNGLLLDRLKNKRNVSVINQYLVSYSEEKEENEGYDTLMKYKVSRQEKNEDDVAYKAREEARKKKNKEIVKMIQNMKSILEKSIEELKKEKGLESFKVGQDKSEDTAICGLVQRKNSVKLAIVAQSQNETKAVFVAPRQLIALIDNITKPIIIQAHKEPDRALGQQAAPQIIAHFNVPEGRLEVKEGLQGRVIATKDDITEKRSYKVDIDVLLAYYKIFSYEQNSKEEFEKLLYRSEIYASYEIN
jgi:hypothetical protein